MKTLEVISASNTFTALTELKNILKISIKTNSVNSCQRGNAGNTARSLTERRNSHTAQ